jgi:prophage tail gpP-like protein
MATNDENHVVTAIVEGQQIGGWSSGNIESSMVTPADSFVLRMPFSRTAWNALRIDARIAIKADGTALLDGFIDKRVRNGRAGILEVHGRDRVGRLVDESAPAINYSGLTELEAVRRLASPWFSPENVGVQNAKNRRLRRGKGRRAAAGNEPVVTFNVRVPRRGQVHPGETRWHLIHEILSRSGHIGYSSSDGREFIIGKPNQTQAPQYLFALGAPGSKLKTTVRELTITEDAGDRYSMYLCAGVGGQGDTNYGRNVVDNRGVVFDNPFNRFDGTGRDFIHPKRMFLPERAFDSFADAQQVAANEQARRDFKRHIVSVEAHTFGQDLGTDDPTLFAPDTVARVIDEELGIDDKYVVYSCSYSFNRDNADRTTIHMVPVGTDIIL